MNGIDDPPWVEPGRILVVPSIDVLAAPDPVLSVEGFSLDVDTTLSVDPVDMATMGVTP